MSNQELGERAASERVVLARLDRELWEAVCTPVATWSHAGGRAHRPSCGSGGSGERRHWASLIELGLSHRLPGTCCGDALSQKVSDAVDATAMLGPRLGGVEECRVAVSGWEGGELSWELLRAMEEYAVSVAGLAPHRMPHRSALELACIEESFAEAEALLRALLVRCSSAAATGEISAREQGMLRSLGEVASGGESGETRLILMSSWGMAWAEGAELLCWLSARRRMSTPWGEVREMDGRTWESVTHQEADTWSLDLGPGGLGEQALILLMEMLENLVEASVAGYDLRPQEVAAVREAAEAAVAGSRASV